MPTTDSNKMLTNTQYTVIQRSKALCGFGLYGTERADSCACNLRRTRESMANDSIEGNNSSTPTTAPRPKFCCPTTCLNTSTDNTLKLPPMTFGAPKSLITYVNTTVAALIRPYLQDGSVIVKKRRSVPVPIESAASYRRASASDKAVVMIIIACGKVLYTSARMMPGAP